MELNLRSVFFRFLEKAPRFDGALGALEWLNARINALVETVLLGDEDDEDDDAVRDDLDDLFDVREELREEPRRDPRENPRETV